MVLVGLSVLATFLLFAIPLYTHRKAAGYRHIRSWAKDVEYEFALSSEILTGPFTADPADPPTGPPGDGSHPPTGHVDEKFLKMCSRYVFSSHVDVPFPDHFIPRRT